MWNLGTRFEVGKTQISDILKYKAEFLRSWLANENLLSKQMFPKTEGFEIR